MSDHVVIVSSLNLREGPDTASKVLAMLQNGTIFAERAVPAPPDWIAAQTQSGQNGFVARRFTAPADDAAPPPAATGEIRAASLKRFAPGATQAMCDSLAQSFRATRNEFGLVATPLHERHFLAQIHHESGGFHFMREIWGPTPAQVRYEGRRDLGNTVPGDGKRFRGRGFIQITGRHNYTLYGGKIGRDIVNNPALAEDPQVALRLACSFWKTNGIDGPAGNNDIDKVTRLINGGTNGLAQRKALLKLAETIWAG